MPTAQPERSLHILSAGPFGRAVARYIQNWLPNTEETVFDANTLKMAETWPSAKVHAIVAWRSVPQLCFFAEEVCYRWNRIFVPLIVDTGILRLGPVIVPGASCWNCWIQRSRERDPWPEEQSALLRYYSENPDVGPRGFLDCFAVMGAGGILRVLEEIDAGKIVPGFVWELNLVHRSISSGVLVGLHDCPRCGSHRPAVTRSFLQLKQDLDYLQSDLSAHPV